MMSVEEKTKLILAQGSAEIAQVLSSRARFHHHQLKTRGCKPELVGLRSTAKRKLSPDS